MHNDNQTFKKDFDEKLARIKTKLSKGSSLTDEDLTFLLMASSLEEEG